MIRIYDTKQHCKVALETVRPGKLTMYVCGPTVYNYIHIGNARTFLSFDIIRRYFMWRGLEVTFAQNITDVDDKIIAKAHEEGKHPFEVARFYTDAFIEDMHAAGVLDPDIRPKATEEIATMIDLIRELIEGGHAYEVEGDVYFAVRSFPSYGVLSGRDVDEMESGHRELRAEGQGLEDRKRDPLDFAVWKAAKPGEPSWESPWGLGRPGWHIECSAMARKYLGLPFDIHGGGADLVFPHHENERAQSEAVAGSTFSRYWMHGGMLRIDSEKMSKSLGNFMLLRDVLRDTKPEILRMLMAQTHYRSPLDFSQERLQEAQAAYERIEHTLKNLDWLCAKAQDGTGTLDVATFGARTNRLRERFIEVMDDDINTAGALGEIFSYLGDINTYLADVTPTVDEVPTIRHASQVIEELLGVFGIEVTEGQETGYPAAVTDLAVRVAGYEGDDPQEAVERLIAFRAAARKEKDWAAADAVRDGLTEIGLVVEDTPQGARVFIASS